jgi:RNA polymerase sigma-70 factor (ECF subfamily)
MPPSSNPDLEPRSASDNMTPMAADDPLRRLVAAAVEGDDAALAQLVRQTQPAVARICALLGSGADVDDLVQDTYVRALRSLSGYRAEAPVETWLLSIARRVCADQVRRAQRDRRLLDRLRQLPVSSPAEVWSASHSDASLIDSLDVDRREAFVLTQFAGLSYEEAAAVACCPVGTIRSRVARARADLQRAVRRAEAL